MTSWVPDPAFLHRPVYRSLAAQIAQAISDGVLPAGVAMPTHRGLADRLGISVQTVSRAYEELIRQGLLTGEVGRGTFVRASAREPPPPPFIPEPVREVVDLSILKPVGEAMHLERLRAAMVGLATDLPPSLGLSFRPSAALARHRAVAVGWLRRCGLDTAEKNVIVTNGATPAMTMALMVAARPGACVVTEEIGHHTLVPLCAYLGLRLGGLAIDGEGVLPDAFARACREAGKVAALFVHPNAASPTSALMGAERRAELVAIARRHGVLIIENGAWGPLIADVPPPLAQLAPERTLHVTSFTKCVLPGLRTGFLVVPDKLVPAAANRHLVTNWIATPLTAEIAARWIEDGTAQELVRWQRAALRRRQAIAAEILDGLPYAAHREGLHLWLPLPQGVREDQFVAHARLRGVAVAPSASFVTGSRPPRPAVRIAVGPTGEAELRAGLGVVADLYRSEPEPALLAI
jgi:DNA-binding transcriptional MocR family regulator